MIDESFNDETTAETVVEEEKEKPKEKTVSARLMLTEEQVSTSHHNTEAHNICSLIRQ